MSTECVPGPHALGVYQHPSSSSPLSGRRSHFPALRREDIVKSDGSEGTELGPELKVWTLNLLLPSSLNIYLVSENVFRGRRTGEESGEMGEPEVQ